MLQHCDDSLLRIDDPPVVGEVVGCLETRELEEELDAIIGAVRRLHMRACAPASLASGSGDLLVGRACPGSPRQQFSELLQLVPDRQRAGTREVRRATVARRAGGRVRRACRLAANAAPVLLTAPFYACVAFDEWYIDEAFAIVQNPDVKAGSVIKDIWVHDFWGQDLWPAPGSGKWTHKSFRPVVTLSFRAQLAFGPLRPNMLRLANCAIHSFNVLMLQIVMWTMQCTTSNWRNLCAALFALHPVHLENIPYLVGRADSLATTFLLLGLALALHHDRLDRTAGAPRCSALRRLGVAARVLGAAACAPLAGLCKETGFVLPAIIAMERLAMGKYAAPVAQLAWFVVLAFARCWYVGGTEVGFAFVDTPVRYSVCVRTRCLSYMYQHAVYAKLMILPWGQSWDYSYDALPLLRGFSDVRCLAVLAAYAGLAASASYVAAAHSRSGILALGSMVLPFLPFSNLFFLVGTTVAERLLYPCTVGWSLLIAALFSPRLGRARRVPASGARPRRPARPPRSGGRSCRSHAGRAVNFRFTFAVLVLCGLYGYRSLVRLWQWRSKAELFQADMRVWHRSSKVVHQYASVLHGSGHLGEALLFYNRSLEIFDDNALTDYCIAQILLQLGRFDEARTRFEKILGGHGIGFGSHNTYLLTIDYGWLLTRLGRYTEALPFLSKGLDLRPDVAYAWNALGVSTYNSAHGPEDVQRAMDHLLKAVELQPRNAVLWSNTAAIASAGGAVEQAKMAVTNAIALSPSSDGGPAWNANVLLNGVEGKPRLELFLELL